jgi:acetyl-CoA carboxylase biotin carboxyl carrier protein
MSKDVFGFDANFLKQIKGLMKETGIQELEIEDGDKRYIKISKKSAAAPAPQYVQMAPAMASAAPVQPSAHPETHAGKTAPAAHEKPKGAYDDETKYFKIKSPVIGTFYASPSPASPPFVKVGDRISKDTTVCIVEAMKVMNEIKADTQGKIVEILKSNANPVLANEPLFIIEKA